MMWYDIISYHMISYHIHITSPNCSKKSAVVFTNASLCVGLDQMDARKLGSGSRWTANPPLTYQGRPPGRSFGWWMFRKEPSLALKKTTWLWTPSSISLPHPTGLWTIVHTLVLKVQPFARAILPPISGKNGRTWMLLQDLAVRTRNNTCDLSNAPGSLNSWWCHL